MSADSVYVALKGDAVFIRIIGRGTFQNSHAIKKLLLQKITEGCQRIFVDLNECTSMDSTFMGMLTGVSLKLKGLDKELVKLINVSTHNIRLLETLGLNKFLDLIEKYDLDNTIAWTKLEGESLDKLSVTKHMLEAHEQLIDTGGLASRQFKNVHKMLKEDLEKQIKKESNNKSKED